MKRIVWTRPAEDWDSDQKWLKGDPQLLRLPLTRQVEITPQLPPKPCDAVILTSKKAADAFLHRISLPKEQLQRVEFLTFGMETYKHLLAHKLKSRLLPAHGGKEFASLLLCELKKDAVLWFPRPVDTAFPISEYLRTHQIEVYDMELYRTESCKTFEAPLIQQLIAQPAVVCFASPHAVKAFVELVRQHDEARFYHYTPVAIGATTMTSGQSYFSEIHQAQQATLQGLWEKALEVAREGDPARYLR